MPAHSRTRSIACVVLALALTAPPAWAAPVTPNAGILESQTAPGGDHLGLYGYLGVSTTFGAGPFVGVPEVLVEWAPEGNHWGVVAVLTADYPLTEYLGADLILAIAHDQPGTGWHSATFGAGPGVGLSIIAGAWTLSPFAIAYKNLGAPGWTWTPGLNIAWSPS